MRFKLSLFGGSLLDVEFNTDNDDTDETTFLGFTGRCDGLEMSADRDPVTEDRRR